MRRTQEYLHKYPRDVRIGVLESLVQRVPLDNPRDQAERHLGWDWIAGRNQKSLGMAKGRDNQSRDQPRDSSLGDDGNDYPEQASLAQGPTTPTLVNCQRSPFFLPRRGRHSTSLPLNFLELKRFVFTLLLHMNKLFDNEMERWQFLKRIKFELKN